jgi:hypothetical protein
MTTQPSPHLQRQESSSPLWHLASLGTTQQAAVIRRLAACGHDEHKISSLTGFAVDQVRRVLADAARPAT